MEEEQKTPLTDYYSKPYQGRRYMEHSSESLIIPAAINAIAWLAFIAGIVVIFIDIENGSWIYGLGIVVFSVFFFGFSVIVKAALKYLDE